MQWLGFFRKFIPTAHAVGYALTALRASDSFALFVAEFVAGYTSQDRLILQVRNIRRQVCVIAMVGELNK